VFEDSGVKVIVDGESLRYVDGTEIDFARHGLNEAFRFATPMSRRVRLRRELQRLTARPRSLFLATASPARIIAV